MRNVFLVCVFVLSVISQSMWSQNADEILLTIDKEKITKDEFVRIYQKNNSRTAIDNKSVDEYLDLFINFKLKVIEAQNKGMDTAQAFVRELSGYRKQLVKPYLVDSAVDEQLMKEAFERMQFDIRASHILIAVSKDATPKDTLDAYNKILKIRERILKGEKFETLAIENSEDPSAKTNSGDLGYFTVFQMVYPFESAAYSTEVGNLTMPVRTRFGYHLIKITDKRKAQGQVKVAHIMIAVPKDADELKQKEAESKIKDIYSKIQAGGNFEELAKENSDDKGSAKNGGELPWFGTGRMVPEFESVSFSLKNNGDISEPLKTSFGWHIIKRVDKKEMETYEEKRNEIKNKISKDARADKSKNAVIEKLKKEYNFKTDLKKLADFYKVVDTSVFSGNWDIQKAAKLTGELASFADVKIKQQDFAQYIVKEKRKRAPVEIQVYIDELYQQYINNEIITYEENNLENKYSDFKYLIKEYHDGILLFELTDQMVWSKAVKDTTGLENFYKKDPNKYMWGKRVDGAILKYKNEEVKKSVDKLMLKKAKKPFTLSEILAELNKTDSTNLIIIEEKKFSEGDNDMIDKLFFKGSAFGEDKNYYTEEINNLIFVVIQRMEPQAKTLAESKGLVTADYQAFLEAEWLKELRNKYKIEVNKEVLNKMK